LAEAKQAATSSYDLAHQIQLLDQLRIAKSEGRFSGTVREHLAASLQWMREKQKQNHHTRYNKVVAELGRQHLVEGDVARAILAFNSAGDPSATAALLDMYATDEDLQQLASLVRMGGADDYDRMMIDSFELDNDALLDVRATRMMRRQEFHKAATLYDSISEAYWKESTDDDTRAWWGGTDYFHFASSSDTVRLNGVSIIPTTWAPIDEDSVVASMGGSRFTRKSFAKQVVSLIDASRQTPSSADRYYIEIGNLLFNTPYWGYNSAVWDGGLLFLIRYHYYRPTNYPFNIAGVAERMESSHQAFMQLYGARAQARNFYQKAYNSTDNPEVRAQAAYMMDICKKRAQTSLHEHVTSEDQDRTGYNLIAASYGDTRFGRYILRNCSVYKHFEESDN
jgi:hypothetical protein